MRRGERGFSTLEVTAAVAILAVAMLPLLALQTQATRQAARHVEIREQATAQRNAMAVLREINPMAEPEGERAMATDQTLRWAATPLTRPRRSLRFLGGEGEFYVALYRVDAEVVGTGRPTVAFSVEQVGWRSLITPR